MKTLTYKTVKIPLNIKELEKNLEKDEHLEFHFNIIFKKIKRDYTNDWGICKNGHEVQVPSTLPFENETHTMIKCVECDDILLELKPYAIRKRSLI